MGAPAGRIDENWPPRKTTPFEMAMVRTTPLVCQDVSGGFWASASEALVLAIAATAARDRANFRSMSAEDTRMR